MMRKIEAAITRKGLSTYEVRIYDHDAKMELMRNTWLGFDPQEALKNANRDLNRIGCEAIA